MDTIEEQYSSTNNSLTRLNPRRKHGKRWWIMILFVGMGILSVFTQIYLSTLLFKLGMGERSSKNTRLFFTEENPPVDQEMRRILFAVTAYDLKQVHYLEQGLLSTLADLCAISSIENVDVVLYTSVVWPQEWIEDWDQGRKLPCGTMVISVKDPSWKLRHGFHHQGELFYHPKLQSNYDLFVFTEDDHFIKPRHLFGFWRETQRLEQIVGSTEVAMNYSIGFLRFEWRHNSGTADMPSRSTKDMMVFEHTWNTSSVKAFGRHHIIHVPYATNQQKTTMLAGHDSHNKTDKNNEYEVYFNGGGSYHQGFFMATRGQLLAWKDRCDFHDPWNHLHQYPKQMSREYLSSLYLFGRCKVKQIIPTNPGWQQDFLVHHMSDKYWNTSFWSQFTISAHELDKMLDSFREKTPARPTNSTPTITSVLGGEDDRRVYMLNGELHPANHNLTHQKDSFHPDFSAYETYYNTSSHQQQHAGQ